MTVVVDLSVPGQNYVEDCFVCCKPMRINYTTENGELTGINIDAEA